MALVPGFDRELGSEATDVALLDACSLGDPLVARVERRREILVCDDLVGDRDAPTGDLSRVPAPLPPEHGDAHERRVGIDESACIDGAPAMRAPGT